MEIRRLGNTDLDLTPVGFGTWAIGGGDWGMGWGPQEEKDSIGSILEGLESGINWIDTAHAYGFGLSEEVVGKALREWGQPVIVATKCGVLPNDDKTPRRFASRELILEEVEGSLRRLQVETIDLYQLHWPEPDENIEEAWQTLLDLQAQGKIRWPGVSNYSADPARPRCRAWPGVLAATALQPAQPPNRGRRPDGLVSRKQLRHRLLQPHGERPAHRQGHPRVD